ncbi:MAG: response regulator [Alphaproteobacteria bacterium]|nr:response regulator [Alphaproteobacteria bacterium]
MGTSYSPPLKSDGTPDLERLLVEHRFLAESIHTSSIPLAIYDDQDALFIWNEAYEALYQTAFTGLSDQLNCRQARYADIVRATNEGTMGDDELDEYVARRVAEQRSPEGVTIERHYPADGWFRIHKSATPSGAVSDIAIDINELKQRDEAIAAAQEKADEERRRLENALEALEDGFAIYDANDRLRVFNSKFIEMHSQLSDVLKAGETFENLVRIGIQRNLWDLDDENPEEWLQNLLQHRRENDTYESIAKFQDGRWMRRLETKTPDGERVGIRADITDAKMREFDLEDARADAETATRAKSEFLANMSHEIRTPMNGVLGMAELLSRTELDAKQQEFADIIMKSGNALLTIINDVLDFSKIDAGQLVLNEQPTHLAEIVGDVATLVAATAAEQEVELITRIDPGLPENVIADGGRIRQILINIVGNAVKFTKKGHVYIEVFGPIYGEVAEVTFKIEDTGIGIPEDSLDKIFESFNQVDSSATRKFEGTGLGLAICSRLVDLMGGKIGVDSQEGKGSTFWFTVNLPVHGEMPQKVRPEADISNARVLLVDDNDINLSILKEQAASWNLAVSAVSDGPQAMKALWSAVESGRPYDLVILDYHMPQMDGAMVAQCIRNDARLCDTKIIMLSSADGSVDNPGISELKLEGHLVKPVRAAVLQDTLTNVLSNEKADAPAGDAGASAAPAALTLADLVASAQAAEERQPPEIQAIEPPAQCEAEMLDAELPAEPQQEARQEVSATSALDILVAEDNDINQVVFTQILQETSYSFKIVADGTEAVACYESDAPKLILMDVSMPEMNGMDAAKAIRELEETTGAHVPIVGVTANALRGDREKCLAVGMDDYLAKPVSPAMLKQKITDWLEAAAEAANTA